MNGKLLPTVCFFFAVIISIFVLVTYTNQYGINNQDTGQKDIGTFDPHSLGDRVGIGLYATPIHDPEYGMPSSVYLNHSAPLECHLFFSNQRPDPGKFLVFVLMDFQQVPFRFEEQDADIVFDASVDPYEEKFFSICIPNLTAGRHDVAIVLAMEPYNHSMDPSFRLSTDLSSVRGMRLNLIVDNDTRQKIPCDDCMNQPFERCDPNYPLNDGLLLTKDAWSNKLWYAKNATPGETLSYWINCAAGEEYPSKFAIITLMDYRQIPINIDTSDYAIFGELAAGEKISIPAAVPVPKEKGVHEFVAVWIPLPFEYQEKPSSNYKYYNQDKVLVSSVRVGLNVT